MKNKYLLSLLAALGFSGCGNNNEIWDEPCYYGPGPVWTPDIIISSQVQNEEKETINGIRVVSSYMNQEDSLITDTAYTESREIEHYTVSGIAINTFKFKEYPPKDTEMYLEYTDVDGEKNGAYQTKKIRIQDLGKEGKVTLLKEEKKEEEKEQLEKIEKEKKKTDAIYELDGKVPLGKAVPFGLQHVLAMFVANIAPILIVAGVVKMPPEQSAALIQSAMIIAGIGTLIQLYPLWKVGSGLPIVMGISFTFVSVFCVVGSKYGYGAVMGAALVGGILEGILGLCARYWRRFIPPIVAATVVASIGFSLLGIGANSFGGGFGNPDFGDAKYIIVGTITLISCIGFNVLAKSFYKQLSVLFGLVVGYIAAYFYGLVDLSGLATAKLIAIPQFMPFEMEFHPDAIFAIFLIFLVSATETIGDTSAMTAIGLRRNVSEKEISGSITCDGLVSSFSSLFGCMPITSFSQNVGLIAMTKVVNRFAIMTGAVIMIMAGLFPALGVLLASLPEPVLGGCTLMMFGSIVVSGIQLVTKEPMTPRNLTILSVALGVGYGIGANSAILAKAPQALQLIFGGSGIVPAAVVAIVLHVLLPKDEVVKD